MLAEQCRITLRTSLYDKRVEVEYILLDVATKHHQLAQSSGEVTVLALAFFDIHKVPVVHHLQGPRLSEDDGTQSV